MIGAVCLLERGGDGSALIFHAAGLQSHDEREEVLVRDGGATGGGRLRQRAALVF